jgi:hypothetical protein
MAVIVVRLERVDRSPGERQRMYLVCRAAHDVDEGLDDYDMYRYDSTAVGPPTPYGGTVGAWWWSYNSGDATLLADHTAAAMVLLAGEPGDRIWAEELRR